MNATFNVIMFNMLSLKDSQNEKLAYDVISKINEYGKDFAPEVFDYYEPLKKKYDIKRLSLSAGVLRLIIRSILRR
jgi:hypothetical protein